MVYVIVMTVGAANLAIYPTKMNANLDPAMCLLIAQTQWAAITVPVFQVSIGLDLIVLEKAIFSS